MINNTYLYIVFILIHLCVCVCVCSFMSDSATQTSVCQPPLSMEFSWKEYWIGLPFPSPIIQYYNLICSLNSDLSNYNNELCSLGLFDSGTEQGLHIIFICHVFLFSLSRDQFFSFFFLFFFHNSDISVKSRFLFC